MDRFFQVLDEYECKIRQFCRHRKLLQKLQVRIIQRPYSKKHHKKLKILFFINGTAADDITHTTCIQLQIQYTIYIILQGTQRSTLNSKGVVSTWVIDGFLWPECPRAHHLSTTYDDFPDVDHQMIYHTRGKGSCICTVVKLQVDQTV